MNAWGVEQAMQTRDDAVIGLVRGQAPRRVAPSPGTFSVRHANLIHAVDPPNSPPGPPTQRRSLTAFYCPSHVVPCHAETTPSRDHVHESGFRFSSGIYPSLLPAG
jgi:hypothetical protein